MVLHEYKRELTHVNWITSFLVIAIAVGFISASHSKGPYHDCIQDEADQFWIITAQDVLLSCVIALSLLKLLWILITKPFGDKFFRCLFYTNLASMSTYFASFAGHAIVLAVNNLQDPNSPLCDRSYEVFEWSAMAIKALGVFLGLLEILSEHENKIGYERFVADMKERCQQRVRELTSLDDVYFQTTPEQFVRNANKEILQESNLWAQLEKFLQREFDQLLFETNTLHHRTSGCLDFVYIYCPDLSSWVIPQPVVIDNIQNDKRLSGPVAFVDPIESY